jgi:hypothetical protein
MYISFSSAVLGYSVDDQAKFRSLNQGFPKTVKIPKSYKNTEEKLKLLLKGPVLQFL